MTAQATGRSAAAPAGPRQRPGPGPLLVLLTGTFMTFLDFFIVNVALPSIQRGLGAGTAALHTATGRACQPSGHHQLKIFKVMSKPPAPPSPARHARRP
jgi:hypothetical protein